ncbi:MAG TPA: hypothetical protein VHJ34_09045 [Actinomycetota bacterium]|nr:hypothetical protein [Actinomycetota bacterium]
MTTPVTFSAIDGTPIYYGSPGNYSRISIRAESSFYNKLVTWIRTLRSYSSSYGGTSFSSLSWLGHVGAYVCKDGCHGRGRALDLNYVQWNGYALNIYGGAHASGTLSVRRRYLAVDAACRKHLKYTLDGWYNSAHANHIHMDDHTAPILSRSASSDTKFVQAVCNNFNNAGLSIDGIWGSLTEAAWDNINSRWSYTACDPFTSASAYGEWCNLVMRHGFANVSAGYYVSSAC